MVESKLYKTRLCLLYQRGRCSREYCNFAHGDSELRRSFNARQEHRGRDLRERLDRRRSPLRIYSPERDVTATHSSHGDSPRSTGKRIDRNDRKRSQLDGLGNYSGSLRMSDETEDQIEDRRLTSSDFKLRMNKKLRQMNSEIKMLDSEKRQLEIYLKDKVQEADTLNLNIHKLDMQLSKEKEESKRITTKIKKFIKAHKRHLHLQEELKRSHAQLEKLGDQLDVNVMVPGNEYGSKININIDDEAGGNFSSPLNESLMNSPRNKRLNNFLEAHDTSNQVNGESTEIGKIRLEKLSRQAGYHFQLTNSKECANNENSPFTYEDKSGRGINLPSDATSADKYNVSESAVTVPSTDIAAHSMDENVEVNEVEVKLQVVGTASTGVASKSQHLPFLPPPLIPQNTYQQYKGNDMDINRPDEETLEVDIV